MLGAILVIRRKRIERGDPARVISITPQGFELLRAELGEWYATRYASSRHTEVFGMLIRKGAAC